VEPLRRTHTTLVINPKGGAGKTTIAINLASHFAASNIATTLMDYDPQGSSLNWLRLRAPHANRIHGANAAPEKFGRLRSFDMYVPPHTRELIIDAPAGASGVVLHQMLERADCIIVPVVPSVIDIDATASFIRNAICGKTRSRVSRLAVVANKVRRSMPRYQPLEQFLHTFEVKLLARLVDSDVYLKAAETGVGIFEMEPSLSMAEQKQFMPIVEWVEGQYPPLESRGERVVYTLARTRSA
jgi:chromosome partitioning protein